VPTLLLKVLAYDQREQILRRLVGILEHGTNREVLMLYELTGNLVEGTPLKKVAVAKLTGARRSCSRTWTATRFPIQRCASARARRRRWTARSAPRRR
jgi:hypothetical protein